MTSHIEVVYYIIGGICVILAGGGALYRSRMDRKKLEIELERSRRNRLVQLEKYVDGTLRYQRELRSWLLGLAETGAVNMAMVDMKTMPQPPDVPAINGEDHE